MLYNCQDILKSALSRGGVYIHNPHVIISTSTCNKCSLDQPDSAFQTASLFVQPLLAQLTAGSPYTLQCALIMH